MSKFLWGIRKVLYYIIYFKQYRSIELGAIVIKPIHVIGKNYISLGKSAIIKDFSWLLALRIDDNQPILKIGNRSSIGEFNHITAVRKVIIEDNVLTANRVYISDNLHSYSDIKTPIMDQPVYFKKEVVIGSGSWIGENACIIGASVGKNCVIGANSVVTKDIPDYSVAVGSPAKVIKKFNQINDRWEVIDEK